MLCHAVVWSVLLSQAVGQVPANIGEVEAKVLANRRAIKSGRVILESKVREGDFSTEYSWTIYFTGKEIRQDTKRRYGVVPKGAAGPDYTEITCFGNDRHISYSDQIMPDGGTMVLAIRDPRKMQVEAAFEVVDPRILGMAPFDCQLSSRMFHLDSFIGAPNRENLSLTHDVEGGIDCVKIEFKPPAFNVVRVWIAPTKGYNVVRMEQEFKDGATSYIDSVDLEIEKHEKSGIWFPVSQHYQRVNDGHRVTREERLKVTVFSLNEPVDPVVFTPASMNVRPGTAVIYFPEKGTSQYVWDGSKIVGTHPELYRAVSHGASRRWFLFANLSVLFIILAVFFARQYYKRRAVS